MADETPKPTSFLRSTVSGGFGLLKGAAAGITAGGLLGAAIGAAISFFVGADVPLGNAIGNQTFLDYIGHVILNATGLHSTSLLAAFSSVGATLGAAAFGSVGAVSGTMTGVVKSREAATVPVELAMESTKVAL